MVPVVLKNPMPHVWLMEVVVERYPKEFSEATVYGENGYPQYARPDNGRFVIKNGVRYDNRNVIPYSPFFSAK